jgi:hypothetical protein
MDLNKLDTMLQDLKVASKVEDDKYSQLVCRLKELDILDGIQKTQIKDEYYQTLSASEKIYQKKNDTYKELISQFSEAYLEISDFYVGDELPREHYLQSKGDIQELYLLFFIAGLAEPYLEAYHKKYCS